MKFDRNWGNLVFEWKGSERQKGGQGMSGNESRVVGLDQ